MRPSAIPSSVCDIFLHLHAFDRYYCYDNPNAFQAMIIKVRKLMYSVSFRKGGGH